VKLPLGYRYATTYAGIRKENKDDLALITCDSVASAAAVFTTNRVQAAPVRLGQRHLRASGGKVRAILVNSGNANCATRTEMRVALTCCRTVAQKLKIPVTQVLPASTGVIGMELDAKLIVKAVPRLMSTLSEDHFSAVSRAILTTDRIPKVAFGEVPLKHGKIRIAGMAKGAGMIYPRMATTLAFILTDAAIPPLHLRKTLARATDRSFHRLSVDGDTSTNDTVVLLASGASCVKPNEKERMVFEEVLCWVMQDLAEMIARDGEGANKKITVHVAGAADDGAASQIARSIANSPLVKTAIAGADPNWGRILSAAGASGVAFDPSKVDIYLQRVPVCRSGVAFAFSESDLKKELDSSDCVIRFVIRGSGKGETCFWTCDLTEGYVRINASYRT
jgi:glutamate N-acetyltransferase/amino-acid N-acetyltransferase